MTQASTVSSSQLTRELGRWCSKRRVSSPGLIAAILRNNYYIDKQAAEHLASAILKAMGAGSFGLDRSLPIRLEHSKRTGTCEKCGVTIPVGRPIYWNPVSKTVWHETCEKYYTRRLAPAKKLQLAESQVRHEPPRSERPTSSVVRVDTGVMKDFDPLVKRRVHSRTQELMEHYEPEFAMASEGWERVLKKYGTKSWYKD